MRHLFALATSRWALVGVVCLLMIGVGAAYAATSGGGKITVCVKRGSGTLYQQAKCAKHDKKLTWNATGPRGFTGQQGAQGLPGTPGATGTPGTPGTPGTSATSLWAFVTNTSGAPSIVYSKGVSSVSHLAAATTLVTFSQDVSRCAFVATVASTGGGYFPGHPFAQISEEFYAGGWGVDGKTVGVVTFDSSGGAPVNGYPFSIAAFC